MNVKTAFYIFVCPRTSNSYLSIRNKKPKYLSYKSIVNKHYFWYFLIF